MIRFNLRTSVKKIMSAFFSPTHLVDMSLVTSKNKTPAVMQHLFEQLGGNQVVMKYEKGRFLSIFRRTETAVGWHCIDNKKRFSHMGECIITPQVRDTTMIEVPVKRTKKPTQTQQSLKDGFQYIKDYGPKANNQNQMTEWCEFEIIEGSGSPIEGWSLRNHATGGLSTSALVGYPITLRDLRRWVLEEIALEL